MHLWKVSGSGTSGLKAEPDAWEEDNRSLKVNTIGGWREGLAVSMIIGLTEDPSLRTQN